MLPLLLVLACAPPPADNAQEPSAAPPATLTAVAAEHGIALADGLAWSDLGGDAVLDCAVPAALLRVGVVRDGGPALTLDESALGAWPAPAEAWKGRVHLALYDHLLMMTERTKCLGACCGGAGVRVEIEKHPDASTARAPDLLYTLDQAQASYRGAGSLVGSSGALD